MKEFGIPVCKSSQLDGSSLELELDISADLPCLQGHFPHLPVVPGLAQLHWALELANTNLNTSKQVLAIEALKFQHIMQPDQRVCLQLRFDAVKSKLHFSFSDEQHKYSSGRVLLKANNV
ncbi:thioester dehydrase [Agarivorans sp. TSD2052]|uniref:ApeI family dehydratase n=1 Tax=Agarivorans sp. TSD2052 TaxID=2937286 RepID=UPI00200C62C1|nr:thioester dehydrase [Agarivorans sp. TSD2052]UPW19343.1 thioester dehydrase [Agarivorans sp. TSD2052]